MQIVPLRFLSYRCKKLRSVYYYYFLSFFSTLGSKDQKGIIIIIYLFIHLFICYQSTHNEIRQNAFSAGALSRIPLGELTTLPQTP